MIFHDSIYEGHHMMDFNSGHWFGMVFGWAFVILAALIIIYMIIASTRDNHESNQVTVQRTQSKPSEIKTYSSEKANYCSACGEKLEGDQTVFCPNCGAKI